MDDAERLTPGQINLIAAGLDRMADMMADDFATFADLPPAARESFLGARGLDYEKMSKDSASGAKAVRDVATAARIYAHVMASISEAEAAGGGFGDIANDLTDLYNKLK